MAADTDQVAVVETKFGKMVIEFYGEDAPKTVANFIKLAKDGYYNGTTFHRVIPGFMIQGGDPNSKSGGSQHARHGWAGLHGRGGDQAGSQTRHRGHGPHGRPIESGKAVERQPVFHQRQGQQFPQRRLHGVWQCHFR